MWRTISDGEPTAQAAQRLRASELLPAPRDIRSVALTGLFVLAINKAGRAASSDDTELPAASIIYLILQASSKARMR